MQVSSGPASPTSQISEIGSTRSSRLSPISPERLGSPLSTSSVDDGDTASAQLRNEYRASLSPKQSRKEDATDQTKKFHYPSLSEMMRTTENLPSKQLASRSASFAVQTISPGNEKDSSSDAEAYESSDSSEEGLGPSMLRGLQNRMLPCILRNWPVADTLQVATMGRKTSVRQ